MRLIIKVLLFIPYWLVLRPLVKRNYLNRYCSAVNHDDRYPDQWYWADTLRMKYGFDDIIGYSILESREALKAY